MQTRSPIPARLWEVVPDEVVEKLVDETNLQAAMHNLWQTLDPRYLSDTQRERYATKVNILMRKANKMLANMPADDGQAGALEWVVTNLAWCIRTDTTVDFLRNQRRKDNEKPFQTSSRESAHNIFELMSREEIAEYLAARNEPAHRYIGHVMQAEIVRNLLWHEVKRGEIDNISYLLENIESSNQNLVLGTPFFQEGLWDNIPKQQRAAVQKRIHKTMGRDERALSINFAWLAETVTGQEYIKNVSPKLAPKPYKSLESQLKGWEKALKPNPAPLEEVYLYKRMDPAKLGGCKDSERLRWDFNPFGKKIASIMEKSLSMQPSLSLDNVLTGRLGSLSTAIPSATATSELLKTLEEHTWSPECLEPTVQTGFRLGTLLEQSDSRAGVAMRSSFVTGLAAKMEPQEIEDLFERADDEGWFEIPDEVTITVKIDAERMFTSSWQETLKGNRFKLKWRPEVYVSSRRGAELILKAMAPESETTLLVNGEFNRNVTIDLESLFSVSGSRETMHVVWDFFKTWKMRPGHPSVPEAREWLKAFIDAGFVSELMAEKSLDFWEQFLVLYSDHEQHMTPPAALELVEAVAG